jgi:hypothetical protein
MFRSLLLEFAQSWFDEEPKAAAVRFKRYAAAVRGVLRPGWWSLVNAFASLKPRRDPQGAAQVISWEEAERIARAELAFSMFRVEVRQNAE